MSKLRITLKRSVIGHPRSQKDTALALGFTKLNQAVVRPDNPCIRGMVTKIRHLVAVEQVGDDEDAH